MLGLENIQGLDFLNNVNFMGFFSGLGKFLFLMFIVAVASIIIVVYLLKRKEKKSYDNTLYFFEEVNHNLIPTDTLKACELIVPGTSIKVFYVKSKDLYIPRGTKRMGAKKYWYAVRNNRELINFSLTNINKELKEANLDYDHTDMRYANENLKEIIKRNYKDKSTKWWKEYKDVIATVIYIFVISVGFFFLISQINKTMGLSDQILTKFPAIIDQFEVLLDRVANLINVAQSSGSSGIVPAPVVIPT